MQPSFLPNALQRKLERNIALQERVLHRLRQEDINGTLRAMQAARMRGFFLRILLHIAAMYYLSNHITQWPLAAVPAIIVALNIVGFLRVARELGIIMETRNFHRLEYPQMQATLLQTAAFLRHSALQQARLAVYALPVALLLWMLAAYAAGLPFTAEWWGAQAGVTLAAIPFSVYLSRRTAFVAALAGSKLRRISQLLQQVDPEGDF